MSSEFRDVEINKVVAEIDQRPFIQTLMEIIKEVSPNSDSLGIHCLVKRAVRCACLLDLYAETDNPAYIREFAKQRHMFYQEIPGEFRSELEEMETTVREYFNDEKILIKKTRAGVPFSEDEILAYLKGKSGDNLFYGKLLELLIPEWNLTEELQIQTTLFDIGKDLADFEEDAKNGLPNILGMCLSSDIGKNWILEQAQTLREKVLLSEGVGVSPTLVAAIEDNFVSIKDGLKRF